MLAIRSSTPAHIAVVEQFTDRGLRWLRGVGVRGWRRLQAKVSRREPISVIAFGGSNTAGTNDARLWARETYRGVPQSRPEGSVLYHEQFRDVLASAGLNVTVRNSAMPGFGSCQTAAHIKAYLLGATPDLVIFEFGVNDEPEFHAEVNASVVQAKISACFESMARTVLEAFPGAALLNLELEWPGFPRTATSRVSHAHQMVADYYGYPQLRLEHGDDTLAQVFGARSDIRAAQVSSLYRMADGTVTRVAVQRRCGESEWLEPQKSPRECGALVRAQPSAECSHELFVFADAGDGNCACVPPTARCGLVELGGAEADGPRNVTLWTSTTAPNHRHITYPGHTLVADALLWLTVLGSPGSPDSRPMPAAGVEPEETGGGGGGGASNGGGAGMADVADQLPAPAWSDGLTDSNYHILLSSDPGHAPGLGFQILSHRDEFYGMEHTFNRSCFVNTTISFIDAFMGFKSALEMVPNNTCDGGVSRSGYIAGWMRRMRTLPRPIPPAVSLLGAIARDPDAPDAVSKHLLTTCSRSHVTTRRIPDEFPWNETFNLGAVVDGVPPRPVTLFARLQQCMWIPLVPRWRSEDWRYNGEGRMKVGWIATRPLETISFVVPLEAWEFGYRITLTYLRSWDKVMGKFTVVGQDLESGAGDQVTTTSLDGRWKDTYSIAQSAPVHVARGSCRIDVTSDVAGGKVKLIELGAQRILSGPS